MKLMIASDIHGSAFYCGKLMKQFDLEKPDKLLLLGDILYHGPRNALPKEYNPQAVASLLNSYKNHILSVRGNCDTEVDQMVLSFPCLADYAVLNIDGKTLYATHGHVYNKDNLLPLAKGDIMFYGHTHIPDYAEFDENIVMNPGSVSIPKAGSECGYMVFENDTFLWKNLEGNIIKRIEWAGV